MSIKTLKSTFRRSGLLVAAFALVAATVLPAASTYADALNPLTERSLTLSSSSPGWSFTDASGNGTFAPPNSGANGQKAGNTFSFRVSSGEQVKGISFQYCTNPAGECYGPGNNDVAAGVREPNDAAQIAAKHSDLDIVTTSPSEVTTFDTKFDKTVLTGGQPAGYVPGVGQPVKWDSNTAHPNLPKRDNSEGNYIVLTRSPSDTDWTQSKGWTMTSVKKQDGPVVLDGNTDKRNYITLVNDGTNADANSTLAAGDFVKVIFFATDTNYITNPGDKEFFVKINTYRTDLTTGFDTESNIIDGGVTVANVMNRSIEIQTKVLETMDFSVGTVDPNTLDSGTGTGTTQFSTATGKNQHGPCDPIVQGMNAASEIKNVLKLGNASGEFSLRTDTTYSTHSYWRLSSNSSGGATVYYSGVTLSNTVGDQIDAIGASASAPVKGSEQFGLALDNGTTPGDREVSYVVERGNGTTNTNFFQNGEDNDTNGVHPTTIAAVGSNASWHTPRLFPLSPNTGYGNGTGTVNSDFTGSTVPVDTRFAFDPESSVIPTPFANGTEVLDCATGKMRYIANIAATTPAGIYTTKINYIAAPKY